MTKNQIMYAQHLEQRRSNRRQEALTAEKQAEEKRKNFQAESLQFLGQQETMRSNLAREKETARSNLVREGISQSQLEEQKRANLETESIKRGQLSETMRANYAKEQLQQQELSEAERTHKVHEGIEIGRAAVDAADKTASQVLGQQKLAHEKDKLDETRRHNLVAEAQYKPPVVNVTTEAPQVKVESTPTTILGKDESDGKIQISGNEPRNGGEIFVQGNLYRKHGFQWEIQTPQGSWKAVPDDVLPFEYTGKPFTKGGGFSGKKD